MTVSPEIARDAKAWPFKEAQELLSRLGGSLPEKGYVLFETGYGPSGLPHIGTFGEVVRTTMVRHAFATLTGMPTKLFAFSDDMDGLRKVPDNVPNQEMLAAYAEAKDANGRVTRNGSPLTTVPDPFGEYPSFGEHNNARLRAFLDQFGFDYDFKSATDCYRGGDFDDVLRGVLTHVDRIRGVVAPTLGAERRQTYCPFLPVLDLEDPDLGAIRRQVLHHVRIVESDAASGTALFQELTPDGAPVGEPFEHSVLGGHCKLQWRVDWAMRWVALAVDYEMSGKDLIDSVKLSGAITRILGGKPPSGFTYELFLDENGEKISKSKGNGLAVEEWLRYAPEESLALFMYQQPRRAKRLYFDAIPKTVDEYVSFVSKAAAEDGAALAENPAWHIHSGTPPEMSVPVGFGMLLNLASVVNAAEPSVLWGFIERYVPGATPDAMPFLDRLVGYAIRYYTDFVRPTKSYRAPTDVERAALADLGEALAALPADADGETIQTEVYEIGKRHAFENLRDWFRAQYEVLLGQSQGPRMGSFIALYGVAETRELIDRALAGDDLSAA